LHASVTAHDRIGALRALLVHLVAALSAVVVAALTALPAAASQIVDPTTGSIAGTVRDATGAVVPDVAIVASGPALMTPHRTTTDAAGAYLIVRLPPGDYTLSFARQGFAVPEHAVRVSLGFTATLDVTLTLEAQRAEVVVTSRSGVLDRHSAAVADTFNSTQLDALPSSRSLAGVIGLAHAMYMPSMEVGAGLGLLAGSFSAYGRNSSPRHTIEGIVVTGLFGAGFTPDYGALEETAVLTAAHGAEWPTAGIHTQLVTKSGGNRYAGSLHAGYENRHWQSANMDSDQVARVAAGGGLSASQVNQVWKYRDLNVDAGGFVRRDRLWWYSSIRGQEIATRLVNFPVEPHRTQLTNYSGKVTARAAPGHTLVGYGQRGLNVQPYSLDPFGPPGSGLNAATAINEGVDSTAHQRNVSRVWKGEWDAVVGDRLLFDVRVGQFGWDQELAPRSRTPRFEDIGTLLVSGGNRDWRSGARRNQLFGTVSYLAGGRTGSHHLKGGVEAIRFLARETWVSAAPGNVLHVLTAGTPSSVLLFATPSHAEAGLWTYSAYASDSWRLKNRLTLTLGVRFDRYRVFLPAQEHPAGSPDAEQFAAQPNLIDWNTFGPRVAGVYDVTGAGTTLAKFSYSRYHTAPNAATGFNSNPNAAVWWTQHTWSDANGSGVWEPGEEALPVLGRRGGTAVESIDPLMRLPVLDEAGAWVERELPARIGVRTGVIWRRERSQFARQNLTRPFDAFTVPVQIRDPGPDGTAGTADDGAAFTAYDLHPDFFNRQAANVLANVADFARNTYWTWEIAATRRAQGRWSLGAGFSHTWNRDHASAYAGQAVRSNPYPFTPNDLINAGDGGAHEFTTWTAKAHGTYDAPWDLHITPVLRHQSGQPFGRTFTTSRGQLLYSTVTVLAEPVGSQRLDNITLLDVRVEKRMRLAGGRRLAAFIDVFNTLNANPEQNLIWSSGPSYFRPLNIVSPRVAKVGVSFDW
jgi:hypothetical protein